MTSRVSTPRREFRPSTRSNTTTSAPIETRTVERRRTRSLFIALGVVGLLAIGLGRCSEAAGQLPQIAVHQTRQPIEVDMATVPLPIATVPSFPPTTPTSTRVAVPARPSPGCANPASPAAPGTSDVSVVSRGERRSYLRTIPIDSGPAPVPLVVVLDDGSGDPAGFLVQTRWGAIAQSRHLLVMAPRWSRADDEKFVSDAIVDMAWRTCVDLARVYLAGFSAGAVLGGRVACEHPELVAAMVAVSGLVAPERCRADVRVPVLAMQGALDEVVPTSSVDGAARAWAAQDRCQTDPSSEMVGWNVVYLEYAGCEGAVEVQLYLISDMGHEWPERVDDPRTARRWADLMSTTTIAMSFFDANAR